MQFTFEKILFMKLMMLRVMELKILNNDCVSVLLHMCSPQLMFEMFVYKSERGDRKVSVFGLEILQEREVLNKKKQKLQKQIIWRMGMMAARHNDCLFWSPYIIPSWLEPLELQFSKKHIPSISRYHTYNACDIVASLVCYW